MARKHNYLNNKDLLIEIHKSKNTYVMFRDPKNDHDFDMILQDKEDITGASVVQLVEPHPNAILIRKVFATKDHADEEDIVLYDCTVPNIILAKEYKAKRIAKIQYDAAVKAGEKVKQAEFLIDPTSYTDEDIIFRINTFEHIPIAPPKVSKVKPTRKKMIESALLKEIGVDEDIPAVKTKYVKVNFPPFYHYRWHEGELIQASRIGYRITAKFVRIFFGHVFNNPETVINEEMLKPELQDMDTFVTGMKTIIAAHKEAALNYFADGSIEDACPPLKALLNIMAYGEYEGKGLESKEIRSLFTRESMLNSDWYQARLDSQQSQDIQSWTEHVDYLKHFLAKESHSRVASRLNIASRLTAAKCELEKVSSKQYLTDLVGTLGRQPI